MTAQSKLWKQIFEEVSKHKNWQVDIRRWLHQNAETAFNEVQTSAYIQKVLKELDIPFTTGWGKPVHDPSLNNTGTGIVAHIGTMKAPCIVLRADMDALPIQENTGLEFSSKTNAMHACGHDIHVSMLLTAARYLKAHESGIKGTVRLVFQPAEESGGGGKSMVNEGALIQSPPGQAAVGLHVMSHVNTGTLFSRPGPLLSAAYNFSVVVEGTGGHASMPHLVKDPIPVAANIISSFYSYAGRKTSALEEEEQFVISITHIYTPHKSYNVLPPVVTFGGTIRTFSDATTEMITKDLTKMTENIASGFGIKAKFSEVPVSYICTNNDNELFSYCAEEMKHTTLPNGIDVMPRPFTGSEDFSFYSRDMPCCYLALGAKKPQDPIRSLHSPDVVFDEECMPIGSSSLCYLAMRLLEKYKTT